jgi:hypothetical protein
MRIYFGMVMAKVFSGNFFLWIFTDGSFGFISFAVDMEFIAINGFYLIEIKVCDLYPKKGIVEPLKIEPCGPVM